MSGWSAFWLHLYFSLLLLSLPSPACNCVRSLEDSSRLVFHSFTIFIPSFWFQVPLILGSGALAVVLFLLKIGFFFFTGVLVFWFLVLKFYTRYFYFSLVRSSISCFYFGISPLSLLPFYIACMRYSLLCLLPFLFLFLFCLFFVGWDG